MTYNLGDRHKAYEAAYDQQIIRRIPVIIRVDGINFTKVTRKLQRPYCPRMMELMAQTMLATIKEIEGSVFGYQQSDEISYIIRNDQSLESEPWFGNRTQKMASVAAAKTTFHFLNILRQMADPPKLMGNIAFDGRVFAVPNSIEAINNLLFRQQDCTRNALTGAARAELGKKLGLKTADQLLKGKNGKDREALLQSECGIDFYHHFPAAFRHGIGAYKIPKIFTTNDGQQITRQRWALDLNLPKFNESKIISGILDSGKDIFRAERDLEEGEDVEADGS